MTRSCPTVHSLLAPIIQARPTVIGVDGIDGCGKSTLASELAGHTHYEVVCLDDFLDKNKGTFVDHINTASVRSAVRGRKVIVEGVCLLRVLSDAGLEPDLLIYVKRFHNRIWADEFWLGLDQDLEVYLEKLRISVAAFSDEDEPVPREDLATDVIRYHHEYRPHQRANLTFFWNDS